MADTRITNAPVGSNLGGLGVTFRDAVRSMLPDWSGPRAAQQAMEQEVSGLLARGNYGAAAGAGARGVINLGGAQAAAILDPAAAALRGAATHGAGFLGGLIGLTGSPAPPAPPARPTTVAPAEQAAPASTPPRASAPVFSSVDPISGRPLPGATFNVEPPWQTDGRQRPVFGGLTRAQVDEALAGLSQPERVAAITQMLGRQPQRTTGSDLRYELGTRIMDQERQLDRAELAAQRISPAEFRARELARARVLLGIGTPSIEELMSARGSGN